MAVTDPPAELKSILPFIQRANELRDREPVMAYQCEFHAANLAYPLVNESKSPEGERYLLMLLDDLEALKTLVGEHPAMASEKASASYVLEFGLRVFMAADNEDRSGQATKYQCLLIIV